MLNFEKYLNERYVNAIDDLSVKEKYASQVWDILQDAYKSIGGIKGSGFESKEAMVAKIPFWKMAVKNGKVVAVIMYKDKGGRKSVAIGTDGSPAGKIAISEILREDIKRSFGEKSKAALGLLMKTVPWVVLEAFTVKPSHVKSITGNDVTPIKNLKLSDLPTDAKATLEKYPQLWDYGYIREIGGKPTFKVLLGTIGQKIKV